MIIPLVFYVVIAAAQLDLGVLRRDGWLFDMAEGTGGREDKYYGYHSYLGENVPLVKRLISY
jgi:SulP family sulfate permease